MTMREKEGSDGERPYKAGRQYAEREISRRFVVDVRPLILPNRHQTS